VWDLAATARAALPRVALMLTERGRQDAALTALASAAREDSARRLRAAHVAALAAPALLITGGYDPLTSPGQRDAFRRASPGHRLLEVAGAGHFVHADEPLQYASAVSEFVLAGAGDLSGTGTGRAPATSS